MKKFLFGLLTGLILAGMVVVIGLLVAARLGDSKPTVPNDATLILRLEGEIPEKPSAGIEIPFLQTDTQVTMVEVWQALRRAASDPKIKAVVLQPRDLEVGWAKLEELRTGLTQFKRSGKQLHVFLRAPGTREYYLATAADRIVMVPEDWLDVKGLRAEVTYLKGALDKLGVRWEGEHAGKYKDAMDTLTRKDMSPETREVINSLLDGLYGNLVAVISASRRMDPGKVTDTIDRGPFLADQAKAAGLIDELWYEDEFFEEVKKKLGGGDIRRISLANYVRAAPAEGKNKIAVVVASGEIIRGQSVELPFAEENRITVANTAKVLKQVANDASVKGVIFRVDSPGGDAIASDEILREAKLLSKKKPLVISMSDVAASGGYYISMTGDPIVAYPETITGSIGVIFGKANLQGTYDKLGLTKELVQRGKNAAIDSEYYPLTPDGRKKLREGVESVYKTFVGIVATSRKKSYQEIDALAQGRVWLGNQAKDRALIDEMGGFDKALELVRARAKLGADETVRLVVYPPKKSLLEQVMAATNPTDKSIAGMVIDREVRKLTGDFPLELYRQGGMLKMMPFQVEFR